MNTAEGRDRDRCDRNQNEKQAQGNERLSRKKPYRAPRLTYYGPVSALTAAGSLGNFETVTGQGRCSMSAVMRTNPVCT